MPSGDRMACESQSLQSIKTPAPLRFKQPQLSYPSLHKRLPFWLRAIRTEALWSSDIIDGSIRHIAVIPGADPDGAEGVIDERIECREPSESENGRVCPKQLLGRVIPSLSGFEHQEKSEGKCFVIGGIAAVPQCKTARSVMVEIRGRARDECFLGLSRAVNFKEKGVTHYPQAFFLLDDFQKPVRLHENLPVVV